MFEISQTYRINSNLPRRRDQQRRDRKQRPEETAEEEAKRRRFLDEMPHIIDTEV